VFYGQFSGLQHDLYKLQDSLCRRCLELDNLWRTLCPLLARVYPGVPSKDPIRLIVYRQVVDARELERKLIPDVHGTLRLYGSAIYDEEQSDKPSHFERVDGLH
jgi:hypothetical protein